MPCPLRAGSQTARGPLQTLPPPRARHQPGYWLLQAACCRRQARTRCRTRPAAWAAPQQQGVRLSRGRPRKRTQATCHRCRGQGRCWCGGWMWAWARTWWSCSMMRRWVNMQAGTLCVAGTRV